MPARVGNVTFDCKDPRALAAFWAGVLETYQVQGSGERWAAIIDTERKGPRFYFQVVPDPKTVKNRVHVDIDVADLHREAARLESLGARVLNRFEEAGETWIVMADPEGNEFCIQPQPEVTVQG